MHIGFLDFDGVISTPRAFRANERHETDLDIRWIDPTACRLIADLQARFDIKFVVSSTWRGFGIDVINKVLSPYGLDQHLHTDWKTCYDPDGSRPAEIDYWLELHPETSQYAIFDDDGFPWTDEQRKRWVHSCSYNGFQLHNYYEADKIYTKGDRYELPQATT